MAVCRLSGWQRQLPPCCPPFRPEVCQPWRLHGTSGNQLERIGGGRAAMSNAAVSEQDRRGLKGAARFGSGAGYRAPSPRDAGSGGGGLPGGGAIPDPVSRSGDGLDAEGSFIPAAPNFPPGAHSRAQRQLVRLLLGIGTRWQPSLSMGANELLGQAAGQLLSGPYWGRGTAGTCLERQPWQLHTPPAQPAARLSHKGHASAGQLTLQHSPAWMHKAMRTASFGLRMGHSVELTRGWTLVVRGQVAIDHSPAALHSEASSSAVLPGVCSAPRVLAPTGPVLEQEGNAAAAEAAAARWLAAGVGGWPRAARPAPAIAFL